METVNISRVIAYAESVLKAQGGQYSEVKALIARAKKDLDDVILAQTVTSSDASKKDKGITLMDVLVSLIVLFAFLLGFMIGIILQHSHPELLRWIW